MNIKEARIEAFILKNYRALLRHDPHSSTFTLDERNSDQLRSAFQQEHPEKAAELKDNEEKRRAKIQAKAEKEALPTEGQLELGV